MPHTLALSKRNLAEFCKFMGMRSQRIYFDTSVFGGYFDVEFEEFTKPLFKRINNGEFILLFSAVLQIELELAPEKIVNLVTGLKSEYIEFLEENEEAVDLATEYIKEKLLESQFMLTVCISHSRQ